MVAGHLQEKYGYYYVVLSYIDETGKRRTKWITTGLEVKGNKKRAEAVLAEARRSFEATAPEVKKDDILFADYMLKWLSIVRTSIAVPTYSSYSEMVNSVIVPYFREHKITLTKLKASDIQDFYLKQLERVSAFSVIHYHSNIHKALKYAVKTDLIPVNPADKVERPRKEKFIGSFYDAEEIKKLFEASKGTVLEIPILLGAFYGLRRSEAIGLKWSAVDFERNTITIRHTVTSCTIDGKQSLYASDTTKTKSSRRTLPLVPFVHDRLLKLQEEQKENKKLCGRSYNKDYFEYICVNEIGELIKPDYVTDGFNTFLRKNGFRHIRFHDLRHSCASLMLANNVPMKQIQEWLGHSDFSTTANIYAHLDYSSKISSADALISGLDLGEAFVTTDKYSKKMISPDLGEIGNKKP
ncbi:MAG: tyrosine-type recombinase/integrase [Oscillospiraceae bacterium]|nr:tyrosine-type recombinase/integrase [Oscillospiraceae bacterium]